MDHQQPYSPSTAFMPAHFTGSRESHSMKWHYTSGKCFYLIIREGIIRPATAFIPKGQRPITWFSSNPIWEPTACKGILVPEGPMRAATFEEQIDYGMGLVRIGVARQTAPHPFPVLVKKSRMPRPLADGLVEVALEMGANPQDWWGTFRSVARAQWRAVEVWVSDMAYWVQIFPENRLEPSPDCLLYR